MNSPDLKYFAFHISKGALRASIVMASMRDTFAGEPPWFKYDFTAVSPNPQSQAKTTKRFDSHTAMDVLDYPTIMSGYEDQIPNSAPTLYQTGPFTFSDLQGMGADASSSDHASQSTSRRHSYSIPGEVQTSPTLQVEKVCPLLTGQALHCTPQLCGPYAACLDVSNLPDIEDCISLPCIPEKPSNAPQFMQASQPPPLYTVDTIPRSSTSSSRKQPTRNSPHRLLCTNSDDVNVKSHSRKAHSLVERRYRENLNGNIAKLHLTLLKTKRFGGTTPEDQDEDSDEQQQASSKVRKSDIMLQAVDYVHQTEVELRHMADEIELLTTRVRQLEKLVKCEDCVLMKQLINCSL